MILVFFYFFARNEKMPCYRFDAFEPDWMIFRTSGYNLKVRCERAFYDVSEARLL